MPKLKKQTNAAQASILFAEAQSLTVNKGVFSEHYINTRLKQSANWPQNDAEITVIWEFCRDLYNKRFVGLGKANEMSTRQELLDKVLEKLGFAFLPNTPMPQDGPKKEPDYILYTDQTIKEKALDKNLVGKYSLAAGILEAKKLHHPLGAVSKHETPGRFPHNQVRDYLQEAQGEDGKPYFNWAILTNGGQWRLYCRDSRPSDYFEINFEEAIKTLDNFKTFYAFFHPQAFIKDTDGRCLLDYIRSEALQTQSQLEVDLRQRVFSILEGLANGFYKRPENGIKNTPEDLKDLYDNCLIFLYRLLFVLYAEGKGFLPVRPKGNEKRDYLDRYSLQRLVSDLRNPMKYGSNDYYDLYEQLLKLFALIAGKKKETNDRCNVPRYNGGLFDEEKHLKISVWRLGELTLANTLKMLMSANKPARIGQQDVLDFGETIDYADLEVRQLGSIYEGLLESHLEYDETVNGLRLKGDKTERKATGTYYTPDYIVWYIINHTIKPLCEGIDKTEIVQKAIKVGLCDNSYAEKILKLKVLDPAMGSGHFLVRATEYLADQILSHPTTKLQHEKGESHLDLEQTERAYWRRRVAESCIYGVDLNPLAVELAKLSIWLTCIHTQRPLNFLDHHLKTGNSLIGAKLVELSILSKKKTDQTVLTFGPDFIDSVGKAIAKLDEIESEDSVTFDGVAHKKALWEKYVRGQFEPYSAVADLWTAKHFGVEIAENEYERFSMLVTKKERSAKENKELNELKEKYQQGFTEAQKRKFFHWELEFPEVFFSAEGTPSKNAGFDAVIGNPPYARVKEIDDKIEKAIVSKYFAQSYKLQEGNFNYYKLFLENALALLRVQGLFSMIFPAPFLSENDSKPLRKELFEKTTVTSILEFAEDAKVFGDVAQELTVVTYAKETKTDYTIKMRINISREDKEKINQNGFDCLTLKRLFLKKLSEDYRIPRFKRPEVEIKILDKVAALPKWNGCCDIGDGHLHETMDSIFMNDDDGDDILIKGIHMDRYFVNVDKDGPKPRFVKNKDNFFAKKPTARETVYKVPKIIGKEVQNIGLARRLNFSILDKPIVMTNTVRYLVPQPEQNIYYLLALLNSKFLNWYFKIYSTTNHVKKYEIEAFPLPKLIKCQINGTLGKFKNQYKTEPNNIDAIKILPDTITQNFVAFLAQQMLEMKKQEHGYNTNFANWLEREITKTPLEKLKEKTKIYNFAETGLAGITDVLKKNNIFSKTLGLGDQRYSLLESAYNETMAKLAPLQAKIKATDDLIDQIVYKLYGLTEEEIKVVEGA